MSVRRAAIRRGEHNRTLARSLALVGLLTIAGGIAGGLLVAPVVFLFIGLGVADLALALLIARGWLFRVEGELDPVRPWPPRETR